MTKKFGSIEDVVARQLCTGCGICAYAEPDRFEMKDTLEYCRRPFVKAEAPAENQRALASCPGVELTSEKDLSEEHVFSLNEGWGPVLDVWEGYAADPEIRFKGSSGGVATALSAYAVEVLSFDGVVHTKANEKTPYLNETTLSTDREALLQASGSRYSPSSPCEGLKHFKGMLKKGVFVGKPCDVAALHKIRRMEPDLNQKVGISIGFFCAGTPSTKGVLELLKKKGIHSPEKLNSLRFRGEGWPGLWTAKYTTEVGVDAAMQMTYAESWGFLQKYRQWRCYICPDHTAEFADISVGDPWYREIEPNEPGKSLIIARTRIGRSFILDAAKAGYITLETQDAQLLPASQNNLLKARGSLWARLIVLKLLGGAVPEYRNFVFAKYWFSELSLKNKVQSFYETAKRVFRKKLNKRLDVKPWEPDRKGSG